MVKYSQAGFDWRRVTEGSINDERVQSQFSFVTVLCCLTENELSVEPAGKPRHTPFSSPSFLFWTVCTVL